MLLEVLFSLVFGILFKLVSDITVNRRATARRHEIVTVDAGLQGSFVAVDRGAPRILGVGSLTPGAMLPDDVKIAEIKRGRLRVGDIRLAPLVDQDATRRADSPGPSAARASSAPYQAYEYTYHP